jgi:hypothetical protein
MAVSFTCSIFYRFGHSGLVKYMPALPVKNNVKQQLELRHMIYKASWKNNPIAVTYFLKELEQGSSGILIL